MIYLLNRGNLTWKWIPWQLQKMSECERQKRSLLNIQKSYCNPSMNLFFWGFLLHYLLTLVWEMEYSVYLHIQYIAKKQYFNGSIFVDFTYISAWLVVTQNWLSFQMIKIWQEMNNEWILGLGLMMVMGLWQTFKCKLPNIGYWANTSDRVPVSKVSVDVLNLTSFALVQVLIP